MGAGLSAQAKVKELQALPQKQALAQITAAGVPKVDAKLVLKRVREMETIDGVGVAMLVDGLSGEIQDALAALAAGGPPARGTGGLIDGADTDAQWAEERAQLLGQGWSEPTSALDDGPSLAGYTVWVEGFGKGKVADFKASRRGPSVHVIEFPGRVEGAARTSRTIKLRRKGNSETRWVVMLPTTVIVGSDADKAAAARDARLSLLGGRQSRQNPVEPEPEPEQRAPGGAPRPVTPPWAAWYKANGPGTGASRQSGTQQERLNARRQHAAQHHQRQQQHAQHMHAMGQPSPPRQGGGMYSNGLGTGGKQPSPQAQHRRSIPAAAASSFAEAEEVGESLQSEEASPFSNSLRQFLDQNSNPPPDMPPPSREHPGEVSFEEECSQKIEAMTRGGLRTVSSVSSEADEVEYGTFGSTPSEWTQVSSIKPTNVSTKLFIALGRFGLKVVYSAGADAARGPGSVDRGGSRRECPERLRDGFGTGAEREPRRAAVGRGGGERDPAGQGWRGGCRAVAGRRAASWRGERGDGRFRPLEEGPIVRYGLFRAGVSRPEPRHGRDAGGESADCTEQWLRAEGSGRARRDPPGDRADEFALPHEHRAVPGRRDGSKDEGALHLPRMGPRRLALRGTGSVRRAV